MSNPAWPVVPFPQATLIADHGEDLVPNLLVTEMEAGRAHMRLRDTLIQECFDMGLILTQAQKTEFKTFYKVSCKAGAQPFDWAHPETSAPTTFRFLSMGQFKPVSPDLFKVKFRVEVYT